MPPNRGKSRAHHTHPQPPPQPSDYDTDAPQAMSSAPPPPAPRSTEELNLRVIRSHYPRVLSILHVGHHAVLYTFNFKEQKWDKADVEGSLFVCEVQPSVTTVGDERYGVIILNRRSVENFYMDIMGTDVDYLEGDFIIMQGDQESDQAVYGLWVFSEKDTSTSEARAATWAKIEELAKRVDASKAAAPQSTDDGSAAADQVQSSVPMGRQLSLRDLFGQQRTQDAAWSVINHHNAQASPQPQPQPALQSGQPDMLSQLFMKAKQDYDSSR